MQGPPEWHPAPQKVKDTCKAAVDAATKRGVDITRLAIQYSLQNDDFASTLVGGFCRAFDSLRSGDPRNGSLSALALLIESGFLLSVNRLHDGL